MNKRKRFPLEFKQEAAKLVLEQGYSQAEAARRLEVSSKNIARWVKAASTPTSGSAKRTAEQEELRVLRKEVHRLKLEKEILKKKYVNFMDT